VRVKQCDVLNASHHTKVKSWSSSFALSRLKTTAPVCSTSAHGRVVAAPFVAGGTGSLSPVAICVATSRHANVSNIVRLWHILPSCRIRGTARVRPSQLLRPGCSRWLLYQTGRAQHDLMTWLLQEAGGQQHNLQFGQYSDLVYCGVDRHRNMYACLTNIAYVVFFDRST
jgi:hypothetical protein